MDYTNLAPRYFKPLLRKAGLPNIRFHDLRHTCATLLFTRGVHPKIVSEMLGHSSIAITLDIYSHVIPGLGEAAANAMEDALGDDPGVGGVGGEAMYAYYLEAERVIFRGVALTQSSATANLHDPPSPLDSPIALNSHWR